MPDFAARLPRYFLRGVLVLFVLVDLKSFQLLFFPQDDPPVGPTIEELILLTFAGIGLIGVQAAIVWLDIRIGRKLRAKSR